MDIKRWYLRVWVLPVLMIPVLTGRAVADESWTGLDGRTHHQAVTGIDAGRRVQLADGKQVDLMAMRSVDRGLPVLPRHRSPMRLYLRDGSVLPVDSVSLKDQQWQIRIAAGRAMTVGRDDVLGVLTTVVSPSGGSRELVSPYEGFMKQIKAATAGTDRLFVLKDKQIKSVGGQIRAVDDRQVTFTFGGADRRASLDKVYGLTLAHGRPRRPGGGWVRLQLVDGGRLWARDLQLSDGQLSFHVIGRHRWQLPWHGIASMQIRSDRMEFLGDLKPTRVVSRPIVARPADSRGWFVDRAANVIDGRIQPIRLDGRAYDKGLCILPETTLGYDLAGGYQQLTAIVGLDDQTQGRGDVQVRILVDGKLRWQCHLAGRHEPRQAGQVHGPQVLNVPVRGAQTLTIEVTAAGNLDLSDHLVLADARLISQRD